MEVIIINYEGYVTYEKWYKEIENIIRECVGEVRDIGAELSGDYNYTLRYQVDKIKEGAIEKLIKKIKEETEPSVKVLVQSLDKPKPL